jgi:hypothetical protein
MTSDPSSAWSITGHPIADARRWLDNVLLPPALQREFEREYTTVTAGVEVRVKDYVKKLRSEWTDGFERWSTAADEVGRDYSALLKRAKTGAINADAFDDELARLERRRRVIEARASEPERVAQKIADISADPLGHYDRLLARYPALRRPLFSFIPGNPM